MRLYLPAVGLVFGILLSGCGGGSPASGTTSTSLGRYGSPPTTIALPADPTPKTTLADSASSTVEPVTSLSTTTSTAPTSSSTTTLTTTTMAAIALARGDEGALVADLQTQLTDAGFFRDDIDGVYGPRTASAVVAFHKYVEAERTDDWNVEDWVSLANLPPPDLPDRDEPNRIELDLTRQLGYLLMDGELEAIIPISSGNGERYISSSGATVRAVTPRGDYSLYKHYEGWRISYLGGLYRPWYFRGGYAIHGSDSVPPYPASHGCVRVPLWEADWLAGRLWIGLPVHVWD